MRARRASAFVVALALAGLGGERVAAACNGVGPDCSNTTPVCVIHLLPPGTTCEACTPAGGAAPCPSNTTCVTSGMMAGACVTTCSASYVDGGPDGGCTAELSTCVDKVCMQCHPDMGGDPACPPATPDCNGQGYCGCVTSTDCPASTHCEPSGGVYGFGACVGSCTTKSDCTNEYCVVDGGLDEGSSDAGYCVPCFGDAGCAAPQVCASQTFTCVDHDDAGSGDGGASGDAGDGGVAMADGGTVLHDAGAARDATVSGDDGGGSAAGDVYPPGKVEGGGCSLLTVGAAGSADSPLSPVGFGLAGLAGLFFLRRSQRRTSRRRTEGR